MGCFTSYGLSIEGPLNAVDKAEAELSAQSMDAKVAVAFGYVHSNWYDCIRECSTVAHNNPDVLIILTEYGGDLLEHRWKGDEYETQQWVCPSFANKNLLTKYEKDNT